MLLVVRAEPNWWKIFVRIFPPGSWFVQGGFVVFESQTEIEVTYLISLNETNFGTVISNGGYFTESWARTKFKITRSSTNYNSYVSWIVAGW